MRPERSDTETEMMGKLTVWSTMNSNTDGSLPAVWNSINRPADRAGFLIKSCRNSTEQYNNSMPTVSLMNRPEQYEQYAGVPPRAVVAGNVRAKQHKSASEQLRSVPKQYPNSNTDRSGGSL
jgi:hypothetical protein